MSVRVAIAHEWLVRYAGSERCVEEMLRVFPHARLLTTVLDAESMPPSLARAEPSLLDRIPRARRHHQLLLPAMPLAWRARRALRDVDLVISSSHACAKAVRAASGIPHLCYCYTPMRYAWNFAAERHRVPLRMRRPAAAAMAALRGWDRASARRVTSFVAISRAVADRIARFYGRPAEVIHPPVRTDYFTPGPASLDGVDFLYVGRLVSYKRVDMVVEAFAGLPYRLLVVGRGQMADAVRARATPNVSFRSSVADEELRDLYRSARGLVHPCEEDFGIAMAEAQACGAPVIGLSRGGAADIVEHGETGWLLRNGDVEELRRAIRTVAATDFDAGAISARAGRFAAERFRREIGAAAGSLVASRG